MKKLIVSRHPAAIAFVRSTFPAFANAEVVASATAGDLEDADVCGNLPPHLAAAAHRYYAIELPAIALVQRGTELTPDEMRAAGARIVAYNVKPLAHCPDCAGTFADTARDRQLHIGSCPATINAARSGTRIETAQSRARHAEEDREYEADRDRDRERRRNE